MGILGHSQIIESPIQEHPAFLINDVQLISGNFKSLGNPHDYLNQDDLDYYNILNPEFSPWSFTGLPNSRASQAMVNKNNLQLFGFTDSTTLELFRKPLRTSLVILNLPLAVVRGEAPFLSESSIENFLDFWKGNFFPVINAKMHFLTDCATNLPTEIEVLYINRTKILSYISG